MHEDKSPASGREMIERARAVLGVSMDELAELAGKSASTLYQVSAGHVKLSAALRASLQNLIQGHESLNHERARTLVAVRRRLGSSPARLARLLRISELDLADFESGERAIPDDLMDQVHELDLARFAEGLENPMEGVEAGSAPVTAPPESFPMANQAAPGQGPSDDTPYPTALATGTQIAEIREVFGKGYAYPPIRTADAARAQIREHIEQVIESCGPDMARLGWVLVELRRRLVV